MFFFIFVEKFLDVIVRKISSRKGSNYVAHYAIFFCRKPMQKVKKIEQWHECAGMLHFFKNTKKTLFN
jgi:hypothetical protein